MTVDDDGRLASLDNAGLGSTSSAIRLEHDRHPVGDDDWLETLREGDRLRMGRWSAPFDVVRRYLGHGADRRRTPPADGSRRARERDDPVRRFGPDADIFGD